MVPVGLVHIFILNQAGLVSLTASLLITEFYLMYLYLTIFHVC